MANYSNIGSGWASAAQRGRQRAEREMQTSIKTQQLEAQNQADELKMQQTAQSNLELINAQANELARHYRPQDAENMKVVAGEAQQEIKAQLENYGDDVGAFMRGGGFQHLKNYSDAVLNSDAAKTIRSNHKSLTQYLELTKSNPHLISNIDRDGFEKWKDGTNNAFVFHGQLQEYNKPEDVTGFPTMGHAIYNDSENFGKILANYNIDHNTDYSPNDVTPDMLINYVNGTLGEHNITKDHKEQLGHYLGSSDLASKQLLNINESINRGFTGNWEEFWNDPSNKNARINLEQRGGSGTFDQINDGQVYRTNLFVGQEDKLIQSIFGIEKKDYNNKLDVNQINNLILQGAIKAYDTDGNSMEQGDTFGWGYDDDLQIEGIQYGFKVNTDRANGKTKLLTYDDVSEDGDGAELMKNRAKDGTLFIALKDEDSFLRGKDDYVYLEIDLNNTSMAKKLDDVVGKMDYQAKTVAETSPGEYIFEPGKKFSFTGDNSRQAVQTLHNPLENSLKQAGITKYNPQVYSTVMAHALSMSDQYLPNPEGEPVPMSPALFFNQIAANHAQDPVLNKAMNALKDGDVIGYTNAFVESGQMSKKEANDLMSQMRNILNGYVVLGEQFEQTQ